MSILVSHSQPPNAGFQPAVPPVELNAEQLRFRVHFNTEFRTTEELTPGHDFVSQERARAALDLGLGITSSGFNIFVSGLTGAEKLEALHGWVAQQAAQAPTPGDWVYVHNFAYPDALRAIPLAAGRGCRLKHRLSELVKTLREEPPKAFRQEAFDKEKAQLKEKYTTEAQALTAEVEARTRESGFLIQPGPAGHFILIPIVHGRPLESPEEFASLSAEEQKTINTNQRRVAEELSAFTSKQQELLHALAEEVRQIERRFGDALLTPWLAEISQEMDNAEVNTYLAEVKNHIIENLDDFKESESAGQAMPFPLFGPPRERDPFLEYDVNVVVDNSHTKGSPVIVESSPTYLNLFGTIERVVDRFGRLITNFTRIKSGSLVRAHGGYLIFSLEDALTEIGVWKALKRTPKSGRIEIETYEPFALFATSGLKPEPIEIQTKVVVVGTPFLLTGTQEVMIPAANVRNLVLRLDVIEAVEQGQFHLYPIRTLDEGIALLTDVRAGTIAEEGTVNGLVNQRLRDLATGLKAFAPGSERTEAKKLFDDEQDRHTQG